jgi:hypothetical protein
MPLISFENKLVLKDILPPLSVKVSSSYDVLADENSISDLPPIGFCIVFLLGSKYEGENWLIIVFLLLALLPSQR